MQSSYDTLISAFNPLQTIPSTAIYPSRLRSTDVTLNNDYHLSELLNRF